MNNKIMIGGHDDDNDDDDYDNISKYEETLITCI
jgi:hypothetical protein